MFNNHFSPRLLPLRKSEVKDKSLGPGLCTLDLIFQNEFNFLLVWTISPLESRGKFLLEVRERLWRQLFSFFGLFWWFIVLEPLQKTRHPVLYVNVQKVELLGKQFAKRGLS